jgi:hypothetical protein
MARLTKEQYAAAFRPNPEEETWKAVIALAKRSMVAYSQHRTGRLSKAELISIMTDCQARANALGFTLRRYGFDAETHNCINVMAMRLRKDNPGADRN